MVSWQTMQKIREEYREYLVENHPDWNTSTVNNHISGAFYLANNDCLKSFWQYLVSDESMQEAKVALLDYLQTEVMSERAEERAKFYYSKLCMLKDFFDVKYGGVKVCIGGEFDAEELVFAYCRKVYEGLISIDEATEIMSKEIPTFKDVSHKLTIMVFLSMMEGKKYTRRVNMEMTTYFIRRIGKGFGKESLINALKATQENIKYYYEQTGNKSNGMRRGCRRVALENGIEMDFSDNIFTDIIPKKVTDAILEDESDLIQPEEHESEMGLTCWSGDYDNSYTKEDFLNDVYMDEAQYDTLTTLLLTNKNIILQGAPGVGKTYVAKRLAFSILGEKDTEHVKMIQFHQSYSYEDFIMGFRPTATGFELRKGVFYNFCKQAEKDDKPFFFIIDEINRGNLSKIFGELFMLIESDKRDVKLQLLYEDEEFSIPSNVHIIGMMNTADRSLAMMDYALRRRFAFYDIEPAFYQEGFKSYKAKVNNSKFDRLIDCVCRLNEAIEKDEILGAGFRIGHSYFCTNAVIDDVWLSNVVKYQLEPLIKEYWFDEPNKVREWTSSLRSVIQ